ncbi:MAG: hypothetical protein KZQ63_03680 [Candidatus Thiodiazotropha sp. (ex Lucinoma aequizonata)]|nr:hypothetical protein [Candidatus Thiodiazotropha sp. (ex Lucinoma aequizonata)]
MFAGLFDTSQMAFCQPQIAAMGLLYLCLFLLLFLLILGGGVFEPLNSAVLFFELPLVVGVLPLSA